MSFQPSHHSFPKGASGTTNDQWMRRLHKPPERAEDDQPQTTQPGEPKLLEAPSPYATVALVSAKEGLDHLGQLEVAERPTPRAIEYVIVAGHVALGVGLFGVLLWSASTIGAAITATVHQASTRKGPAAAPSTPQEQG